MKLWYGRKSKDPTYFAQIGIRNGKKTTKNIARIGKHLELLKIINAPLSYAKEQVAKYNEEAKKMLTTPDPNAYKKGPHDVSRFIKRTSFINFGEEVTDLYKPDKSIIEEEEKYNGYCAIATNLNVPAKAIIGISPNRYQIEDCFGVMKTNLSAHPDPPACPDTYPQAFASASSQDSPAFFPTA